MNHDPYQISTTFVHLGPDGTSVPLAVDDTFWTSLGSGAFDHLGPGRLVSQVEFADDWTSWEMHPQGEEIVCLLGGSIELVLDGNGKEVTIALREPGAFAIVPRGTWHTANVRAPSSALFITPGDGTQHRERTR